jgi:phosphonoacetate hydrolase
VIEANGRTYAPPEARTVVVCIDGSDPRYIDDALARGLMPRLAATLASQGT